MNKSKQEKTQKKVLRELEIPVVDHKISQLIAESILLEQEEADNNGSISYMARALVQACMPHKNPEEFYFKRKNGNYSLVMTSDPDTGLPYGSIPRLIMIWITSEVVKKKSRELVLGHSLSAFMSELGIPRTGAYIEKFKDQTKRLFSCSISCTYDDGDTWQIENVKTVKRASLTWLPKKEDDPKTRESILLLDKEFFDEIISKPVPIDLNVIKKLKNSSLALDIYCWLTYRMSYLRKITPISWESLHNQFGSNYAQDKSGKYAFKKRLTDQMVKILAMYPDANVKKEQKGLVLYPSKTHIKKQPSKANTATTCTQDSGPDPKNVKKYDNYRLNALVGIIEQKLNDDNKKQLLAEFNEYITRRQLKGLYIEAKNGFQTKKEKQHLYEFVNSQWHHLLEHIDSFADFTKKNAVEKTAQTA